MVYEPRENYAYRQKKIYRNRSIFIRPSLFFEYSTKGNETYHFPYTKTQKNPELSNLVSPLSNFRPDYYICARELSIDRRWAIFCLMFWIMEKRYLVHIPFFGFGTSFFLCHINRSKPLPIFNRTLKNRIQYSQLGNGADKNL